MTKYPLLFTFADKVEGNGFRAQIEVHGRLLAVQEDDGWWMYGVNPGGLAAPGETRGMAYNEFRKILMQVLFDIASRSRDFYAFRKEAKKFFDETNKPTLVEWEAARDEVRAGRVTIDGMRRETTEQPRRIDIKQKQKFKAKDNIFTDPKVSIPA